MSNDSRVTIYSRFGYKLCEIDAFFRRTWKLNEYGEAEIILSIGDAKAVYEYLKMGNLIYAEHDKLPVWGGIIYPPLEWQNFGFIKVSCYSAEYLLKFRTTTKIYKVDSTPGGVFRELLTNMYPNIEPLPIKTGTIWEGGDSQKLTYNYSPIYDAVTTLADEVGCDWELVPVIDNLGRLYFQANWYSKQGVERQLRLIEGKNLELATTPMIEQGEIGNYIISYGKGSTWSEKPTAEAQDITSIDAIGLYAKVIGFEDGEKAQLQSNTDEQLSYYKTPRKSFDITALDEGQTLYNIRKGDVLPIQLYSCGFTGGEIGYSGNARVMGMTYDHEENKLELVMNED